MAYSTTRTALYLPEYCIHVRKDATHTKPNNTLKMI